MTKSFLRLARLHPQSRLEEEEEAILIMILVFII